MNDGEMYMSSNEKYLFEGKGSCKNTQYVTTVCWKTGRINNQLNETHDDIRRGRQGVHECAHDGRQKTRSVKD